MNINPEQAALRMGLCPKCGQDVERQAKLFVLGEGEVAGFVCMDDDCKARWKDPDVG